jgi:hypothetical protein
MLVIRKEQMNALNRSVLDTYVKRLANVFLERFPERFGPSGIAEAEKFVKKKLPLARKYDANSERAVAMFLYFVLVHGEDFESRPETAWAVEILQDPSDPDGESRVERLISRMEAYAGIPPAPVDAL